MGGFRLDELDMRILRELMVGSHDRLQSKREKVRAVAARLGVHRNTVVRRLLHMRLRRFLLPFTLQVDMTRLGWVAARPFYEIPPGKRTDELRDRIFRLNAIDSIIEFEEGWEPVLFARSPQGIEEQAQRVTAITGIPIRRWTVRTETDWPIRAEYVPTAAEWAIVRALLCDARVSLGRVAKETGLNKRLVERHYQTLQEEEVIRFYPQGGTPPAGQHIVMFQVTYDRTARAQDEVVKDVEGAVPNVFVRDIRHFRPWFFAYGPDRISLERQIDTVRTLGGVQEVWRAGYVRVTNSPLFHRWLFGEGVGVLAAAAHHH